MSRAVPLWVGKTDDTPAPPRVKLRVFIAKQCKCHRCGRTISPGEKWTLEHLVAIILGGRNAEDNLDVTCDWCLPIKNAEDVAEKSRTARIAARHAGIRGPSRWRKPTYAPTKPKQLHESEN